MGTLGLRVDSAEDMAQLNPREKNKETPVQRIRRRYLSIDFDEDGGGLIVPQEGERPSPAYVFPQRFPASFRVVHPNVFWSFPHFDTPCLHLTLIQPLKYDPNITQTISVVGTPHPRLVAHFLARPQTLWPFIHRHSLVFQVRSSCSLLPPPPPRILSNDCLLLLLPSPPPLCALWHPTP